MVLELRVPERRLYNENTSKFVVEPAETFVLEHSLASVAKWEGVYRRSYLSEGIHQKEDWLAYLEIAGLPARAQERLSNKQWEEVTEYLGAPYSAYPQSEGKPDDRKVYAEDLYYTLFGNQMPLELEHWHLHRLLALFRRVGRGDKGPEKRYMRPEDIARLNEERLKEMESREMEDRREG